MNFVTKKHLDRRMFLRGLGATLALPLLDSMVPALAETTNPASKAAVRMAFIYVPNGIIPAAWTPAGDGRNFEFQRSMKPLEPFRDHLNVLSGLAQINGRALGDGAGDHARAGATWLTGVHPKNGRRGHPLGRLHRSGRGERAREADAARLARNRSRHAEPRRRLRFRL